MSSPRKAWRAGLRRVGLPWPSITPLEMAGFIAGLALVSLAITLSQVWG